MVGLGLSGPTSASLSPSHHHFYPFSPIPLTPELLPRGVQRMSSAWRAVPAHIPQLFANTWLGELRWSLHSPSRVPLQGWGGSSRNKPWEQMSGSVCPPDLPKQDRSVFPKPGCPGGCTIARSSAGSWLQLGLPPFPARSPGPEQGSAPEVQQQPSPLAGRVPAADNRHCISRSVGDWAATRLSPVPRTMAVLSVHGPGSGSWLPCLENGNCSSGALMKRIPTCALSPNKRSSVKWNYSSNITVLRCRWS